MTLVRIREKSQAEDKIEWILATNLSIGSVGECLEIVEYYVWRWQIERFHFVLKSGHPV
jgi:hypothetical protein